MQGHEERSILLGVLSKAKYTDKDIEKFKVELQKWYQLDPSIVQKFVEAKFDVIDCRSVSVETYVSTVKRRIREDIKSIILDIESFTEKFCAYSGISSLKNVLNNIKETLITSFP